MPKISGLFILKFIFSLVFNNSLSWNPFYQEVLLRNHLHYRGVYSAIRILWSFELFSNAATLGYALFALKQIMLSTQKISLHSTMCIRDAKNSNLLLNNDYYSFKIFPQFWLAKSTRIIHHNQLLMTKFGRILCLTKKWRQKCSLLQVNAPFIYYRFTPLHYKQIMKWNKLTLL